MRLPMIVASVLLAAGCSLAGAAPQNTPPPSNGLGQNQGPYDPYAAPPSQQQPPPPPSQPPPAQRRNPHAPQSPPPPREGDERRGKEGDER
ncbi:hypothetical protein [Tahibacter amnicola]|uniref:Uncharacterized protein n=1 Tax=Tahibacter amnicola TaxID=2976241 RepID=A0ABY6BI36_9GAMM|nr:hypothetical protein [Tahibacter amnicola]UXI69678.1 hypothetical protein N4264_08620 [Tahibacter amnicola]